MGPLVEACGKPVEKTRSESEERDLISLWARKTGAAGGAVSTGSHRHREREGQSITRGQIRLCCGWDQYL